MKIKEVNDDIYVLEEHFWIFAMFFSSIDNELAYFTVLNSFFTSI